MRILWDFAPLDAALDINRRRALSALGDLREQERLLHAIEIQQTLASADAKTCLTHTGDALAAVHLRRRKLVTRQTVLKKRLGKAKCARCRLRMRIELRRVWSAVLDRLRLRRKV